MLHNFSDGLYAKETPLKTLVKRGAQGNWLKVVYGKGFVQPQNTPSKVKFRENILTVQNGLQKLIDEGVVESTLENCLLKHYFTPKDEKYGCCTYAREITIPKGSLVIGKIHRHQHLNFISKGKVRVFTEFGEKRFEAPCTFVSEVGLKRAVYVEEEVVWTTVHLTAFDKEEELSQIETEVISPSYEAMGLIASTAPKQLQGETI